MDELQDPYKDRIESSVLVPASRPRASTPIFLPSGPNWRFIKDYFFREGTLSKQDCLEIILQVSEIFKREPNLIEIQDPVTVVGDIHGQYYDLMKILDLGGNPETTTYLFLGDYVDRGLFSIEVLLLLYSLKIAYPKTIIMLRGNHESRQMTSMFSFRKECVYKYDLEVYEKIIGSFETIPVVCVINNAFIAVHGGISPDLRSLKDIHLMNRFMEPPRAGLLCDLLWADPLNSVDGQSLDIFKANETRGCSYFFGAEATKHLLKETDLITIIRAHEVQKDGYKMQFWDGKEFPSVITVFSAPNYCDCYKNKGAIIKFDGGAVNIQQYSFLKHPYILPDFMNVFTWSAPFVIEKVLKMLHVVVKPKSKIEAVDAKSIERLIELEEGLIQANEIRSEAIEEIVISIKVLREKHEMILKNQEGFSDGANSGKSVNEGARLLDDNETFKRAITMDSVNEKRPEDQ